MNLRIGYIILMIFSMTIPIAIGQVSIGAGLNASSLKKEFRGINYSGLCFVQLRKNVALGLEPGMTIIQHKRLGSNNIFSTKGRQYFLIELPISIQFAIPQRSENGNLYIKVGTLLSYGDRSDLNSLDDLLSSINWDINPTNEILVNGMLGIGSAINFGKNQMFFEVKRRVAIDEFVFLSRKNEYQLGIGYLYKIKKS